MTERFQLGDRVRVSHIAAPPDPKDRDEGETVEVQMVPNPEAERVGVLIGTISRNYCAEVQIVGDGAPFLDWRGPSRRYLVVRYTLRGKRYLTLAQCLAKAVE